MSVVEKTELRKGSFEIQKQKKTLGGKTVKSL